MVIYWQLTFKNKQFKDLKFEMTPAANFIMCNMLIVMIETTCNRIIK